MLFFQRLMVSMMVSLFLAAFFVTAHADSTANLIKKLSSQNVMERRNAARELGKIKDPESIRPLIEGLKDKEPMVRLDASGALIDIGQPVAEPLIEGIKQEKDSSFLWNAIRILDTLGDPKAVGPLNELEGSHPDPIIAQAARSVAERLKKAGGSK